MTRYGMDVGGTFTDVVAVSDGGMVNAGKVRSARGRVPDSVWAKTETLGDDHGEVFAESTLIHGSTVATNALLERGGGRVVLVTTSGFEDILWLRRQDRADLYDLTRDHAPPVMSRADVVGARERVGAGGVLQELTPTEITRITEEVARRNPDCVAISLLFSFSHPEHERTLAHAIREAIPGVPVAPSCEVLPVFREYERTSTTAIEAYLRPVVGGYLERMGADARARGFGDVRIMASNGGTLDVGQARERASALALSGPAGGVEGARLLGAQLGLNDLLTLDMGGTSADASVVLNGAPLMQATGSVGGFALTLPHVLIETVGAGGGSIAWVDAGGALRVGPRSAGALPGPACYGFGAEEPTVTDAALALGWLNSDSPLADDLRLDGSLAREAIARVARKAGLSVDRCSEGIIQVATATMVRALRRVSVERGLDPRSMTLVPFGGAGPMFACRVAESLGMSQAVIPPHAGVLSAIGLASAPERIECTVSFFGVADDTAEERLEGVFYDLEQQVNRALPNSALDRYVDCRYPGQGYELTVSGTGRTSAIARTFHSVHQERYGHADEQRAVEVVNARVVATRPARSMELRQADWNGDECFPGPTTVCAPDFTLRIEAGWTGTRHRSGAVMLERT